MSLLAILGKFHVALDGVGLILQGAPASPAYRMSNAPVYGTRFASGDRDYNDLSQWWYLIQTDWSGGIKSETSFLESDAKYYYSTNIDARSRPGTFRLEKQLELVGDNVTRSNPIFDYKMINIGTTPYGFYVDKTNILTEPDGDPVYVDGVTDPLFIHSHRGFPWVFQTGRVGFSSTTEVEALIVGPGGAGGQNESSYGTNGGGGGGGEVVHQPAMQIGLGSHDVTVGLTVAGTPSIFNGVTAQPGHPGATGEVVTGKGGRGGNSGDGHLGIGGITQDGGGGGGDGGDAVGSVGGAGTSNSISGSAVDYGVGGDGGTLPPLGGPGDDGSPGVVIISYPTGSITATGGTITTAGGNTIHTFTSSGTLNITSVPPSSLLDLTEYVNTVLNAATGGLIKSADVGVSVGDTIYIFGIDTNGQAFVASTDELVPASSSDFTIEAHVILDNNANARVIGAKQLGGDIIFMVDGSPLWSLYSYNLATHVITKIYDFENATEAGSYDIGKRYITPFGVNSLLITVLQGGLTKGSIWHYNGTNLTKIFSTDVVKEGFSTTEATVNLRGGCVVYGETANWGNLVYDGDGFYNFIKDYGDSASKVALPIGTDGTYMHMVDNVTTSGDEQVTVYKYRDVGTTYKNGASHSAFLVMSQHDKLQSIDKLMNLFTVNFERFLTGQAINVYYSLSPIPDPDLTTGSWVSLGTASYALDGGTITSKTLQFPTGIIAKKIWFRLELVSATAGTPAVTDAIVEYLPMPDYKKEWTIRVNCGDEVKRLDGALVETTGRELKSRLEKMWWTKSSVDYEDLDYASTLADGAISDATATAITVDSTASFPEQGRIKIDDEEILYTSKAPKSFIGCTRGARGTRAATHADNAVVHNAYRAIVTGVEEQVPIILKDKQLEYVVTLSLREV